MAGDGGPGAVSIGALSRTQGSTHRKLELTALQYTPMQSAWTTQPAKLRVEYPSNRNETHRKEVYRRTGCVPPTGLSEKLIRFKAVRVERLAGSGPEKGNGSSTAVHESASLTGEAWAIPFNLVPLKYSSSKSTSVA